MKKKTAKSSRLSSSNSGITRRSPEDIAVIEKVFRTTHQREMTPREREQFHLPPRDAEEMADLERLRRTKS